jgi:hypothetical protein
MTRKFDLVRWSLYGKKIAETRNTLNQMGLDAVGGVGQYSNLPDIMYAKRNPDKTVTFLNKYTKASGPVPSEYNIKTNWLVSLYNQTTKGPANYNLWQWRGYTDNTGNTAARYVLPLHNQVISASQGSLQNQYGY